MAPPAGHGSSEEAGFDRRSLVFLAIPLAVSAWRFAPIVGNYFFGDDLLHFYHIVNLGSLYHWLASYGGHSLLTRNLIVQVFFRLFGSEPLPYFALAFATHLANVGLLFAVIRVFTKSDPLASFGALLWGTSPINEHTLGWFAVYGQALGLASALWVLYDLGRIANGARLGRWVPIRWIVLLLAGSTSFGTGIAFAVVLPVFAALVLPATAEKRRFVVWLVAAALLVLAVYIGQGRLFAWLYNARSTHLYAMIQGVTRVGQLARLIVEMLAFGTQSLILNALAPSFQYPDPVTIAAGVAGLALLAAGLVAGDGAVRRTLVALLLLAAACYGIVAVGRVPFVLHLGTLVVVKAPRYHYAAPAVLALAFCVALSTLARGPLATAAARRGLFGAAVGFVVIALVTMSNPIDTHDGYRAITRHALFAIRRVIRDAPPGADVYIENSPFFGVGPLLATNPRAFPGLAALFTIFFPEDVVEGRHVYFVESNRRALRVWKGKGRIGNLIVPPKGQKAIRIPP